MELLFFFQGLFILHLSADFDGRCDHLLLDGIPDGLELLDDGFFGVVVAFGDHDVDLKTVKFSFSLLDFSTSETLAVMISQSIDSLLKYIWKPSVLSTKIQMILEENKA